MGGAGAGCALVAGARHCVFKCLTFAVDSGILQKNTEVFMDKTRICAVAAAIAAAGLAADVPHDVKYKVEATIAGAENLAELEDVPVLLRVPAAITSKSSREGADFAIIDDSGNSLPYDVASWNASGGSEIWVKVKNFAQGEKLTIYFGGAAQAYTLRGRNCRPCSFDIAAVFDLYKNH